MATRLRDNRKLFELMQQMFQAQQGSTEGASELSTVLANVATPATTAELQQPEPEPEPEEKPVVESLSKPQPEEPQVSWEDQVSKEAPAPPKGKASEDLPGGKYFVKGMIDRGWTPEEAAGAAGNVHVESGFRPGVKSSVPGENSYGFLQWNKERLRGLMNMAESRGLNWVDPDTQMDWINMERTGESVKYGGADERWAYKRAFAGGGTPGEIAERFGRWVERPLRLADTVAIRRNAAERYSI